MLLMQYLLDFGSSDLRVVEQFRESEHIAPIRDSFLQGIDNSLASGDCDKLDADLLDMEDNFRRELISNGISFNAEFDTTLCPIVEGNFTLSTNKFKSTTSFSYP